MPKGGAYLVGRMAGKQFRKARWMWASATGSDDEAIRAEQAVGRDMAAAVREDARGCLRRSLLIGRLHLRDLGRKPRVPPRYT